MKKESEETLIKILEAAVVLSSQKTVAKNLGISQQFICDVLKKRRGISERLAKKMGYKKIVYFIEVKNDRRSFINE